MNYFNLKFFMTLCLSKTSVLHICIATNANLINSDKIHFRNFGRQLTDFYLNVSIFVSFTVNSELQCLFQCAADSRCLSYNYGQATGIVNANCVLSSSDRFFGRENFTHMAGFNHRGIMTKCETGNPCSVNGFCIPIYENDTSRCVCKLGYSGVTCNEPMSCAEILKEGHKNSGVYFINPDGSQAFPVYCDMITDGGGWIVLQRRQDGSVNFQRGWDDYKNGFGDLNGEFWLGNEKIHKITASQKMVLRFDLEDFEGETRFAAYENLYVSAENDKYKISFGAYNGTAGDSLAYHQGRYFSTYDADNDLSRENCAVYFTGAWWYKHCHGVNINGVYEPKGNTTSYGTGVNWKDFRGFYYSLKKTVMIVRPS